MVLRATYRRLALQRITGAGPAAHPTMTIDQCRVSAAAPLPGTAPHMTGALAAAALSSSTTALSDEQRAELERYSAEAVADGKLRKRLVDPQFFYFRGAFQCRLCGVVTMEADQHLNFGVDARMHVLREVLVDCFLPHEIAGTCTAQQIVDAFPRRLLDHAEFPRIRALVPDTFDGRVANLHHLVSLFKDLGVLDDALTPAMKKDATDLGVTKAKRNTVEFERAEFFGDSLWGSHVSQRIQVLFPDRDWLTPQHSWSWMILRDNVESNNTMTLLFDAMRLDALLPADIILGGEKPKADIIEAITGALLLERMRLHRAPLSSNIEFATPSGFAISGGLLELVDHALAEFRDLLTLLFLDTLLPTVLPIVRELAAAAVVPATTPPITRAAEKPPLHMQSRRMRSSGPEFTFRRVELHREPSKLFERKGADNAASKETATATIDANAVHQLSLGGDQPKTTESVSSHVTEEDASSTDEKPYVRLHTVDRRVSIACLAASIAGDEAAVPCGPLTTNAACTIATFLQAAPQLRPRLTQPSTAESSGSCSSVGISDYRQEPMVEVLPRLMTDDEARDRAMLARMHPIGAAVTTSSGSTGHVPQVVLDAEAKRLAVLAAKKPNRFIPRKKKNKKF